MSPRTQFDGNERKPEQNQPFDFKMDIEEKKIEEDVRPKSALKRTRTMIPNTEMKLNENINFQSFELMKLLGEGAFGKVYKVKKRDDGKIYAMKVQNKRNLIQKYALTEANVLRTANHPFILSLHYAFQTTKFLYFVLDYCPVGDLSFHLAQKGKFEELEARFFVAELLLAIEHLHSMNIIYRDLKPENILIGEDGHIKLADFGLSKEGVTDDRTAESFVGSHAYLAPEIFENRGLGKAADIYGIGIVLYELLCGILPYDAKDLPKLYSQIKKGKLKLPISMSENAKNLIIKLMRRDPSQRIGVRDKSEIKRDPFFAGIDWDGLLRKEYPPPKLDSISDDEEELADGFGNLMRS